MRGRMLRIPEKSESTLHYNFHHQRYILGFARGPQHGIVDRIPATQSRFSSQRGYVVLAVKRKRQAYIKKKIRDKENQAKREEEQSNFGAEENTVWDRLEVQNEELVAAVQQLKPKARFIVTGYVLKGKTFKELAQETKLTERAAASTYYRSIEKLRIKMEKEK